jgi:hypothetical protein
MRFAWIALILLTPQVCLAEWTTFAPIRKSPIDGVLGDIYSHVKSSEVHQEPDGDKITSGHETCHMLDANLQIRFRRKHAFYMLRDDVFLFDSSKVTMREVYNAVPKTQRGPNFELYLGPQMQGYRNDEPFYCIEELNAYIIGCMVGLDLGNQQRSIDSYNHVLEMWNYCLVAQKLSRESKFSKQKELDEFLKFVYNNRILFLEKQFKEIGWLK